MDFIKALLYMCHTLLLSLPCAPCPHSGCRPPPIVSSSAFISCVFYYLSSLALKSSPTSLMISL